MPLVTRNVTKHRIRDGELVSPSGPSRTSRESGRVGSKADGLAEGAGSGANSMSRGGSMSTGSVISTSSEVPSAKRVHDSRAGWFPSVLTSRSLKSGRWRWTTPTGVPPAFARFTWTAAVSETAGWTGCSEGFPVDGRDQGATADATSRNSSTVCRCSITVAAPSSS